MIKLRLWAEQLISKLPNHQLLGQNRECAALRGNGWGRKHKTINYIFNYDRQQLYDYHMLIMEEMINRNMNIKNTNWLDHNYYRGFKCNPDDYQYKKRNYSKTIYPEHNEFYIIECVENLKGKGIIIC